MKNLRLPWTAILLLVHLLMFSCKKAGSTDTITYEVRITSGTWSGDYFDWANNSQALKLVNNKPDGWKYTFSVSHGQKAGLVLSAIPDNGNSSTMVTVNIYLNGEVIATDSDRYGANAQITIN